MSKQDVVTGKNCSDDYCYYYLHENGDLIHKSKHFDPYDFEESPFCRKWWKIDLTNRADAYNFLIAATILKANPKRIADLKTHWGIVDDDCIIYLSRVGLQWEMDGDKVCVHAPDFTNLQESPAGFGDTMFEATVEFYKSAISWKDI